MIYSMHDFTVANMLASVAPNFNYTYMDYASSMVMEVYRSGVKHKQLRVRAIYNGRLLPLSKCSRHFGDGSCSLAGFLTAMRRTFIVGNDKRLRKECAREPVPADFSNDDDQVVDKNKVRMALNLLTWNY